MIGRVFLGAGGGFDIYAGLPLALSLIHRNKRVQFANLSFWAWATASTNSAPSRVVRGTENAPR